MKVDFTVEGCENGGVVFAIADALKRAGFKVHNCGVMLSTGEPDIQVSPPIDFIDKVPEPLQAFVDGSGELPSGTLNSPPKDSQ